MGSVKGSELAGRAYTPLFPYFAALQGSAGAFRVVADGYVTADSGTGVVHCAPAFGEDDMRVCIANGARCPVALRLVSKGCHELVRYHCPSAPRIAGTGLRLPSSSLPKVEDSA